MSEIVDYDPSTLEPRWQQTWQDTGAYTARDDLPREQCYYVLEMFPYPSGKLHMGHVRNYSIGDAVSRYKRMRGLHVLHPIGWDSFGLPAEQAAIDRGAHPQKWTYENIAEMSTQLKRMGFSYDWKREFATSDPGYSHREQELFLDLVEKGLVYRKSSMVNWSTGLNCVLANEQVIDGKCWRTGKPVIQKELPQWFLRTTAYVEELLDEIDGLEQWPDAVRTQQRNWIGRSVGAEINFAVKSTDKSITVFTTRPDTVFGVTFMSIAPEHSLVDDIVTDEQKGAIQAFRDELSSLSEEDRTGENAPKKGVFTGAYAINPVNGNEVPVFAANFVLADYGTGAVMAVPAHDTRDFAFAKAYDLPITKVIVEDGTEADAPLEDAFTGVGTMTASGPFDGKRSGDTKAAIIDWLEEQGFGQRKVTYRYRDWGLSRQRYWGNPIPYIYGEAAGAVPLDKADLPVTLPEDVTFDGIGNPLERHPTWATDDGALTVPTQTGKESARRETDTMDTFMESSWYFARYTCHDNTRDDLGCAAPLDKSRVDHWLPVDLYIGGIEHACMHLLYARFFQKALADTGHTSVREPFKRLLCQGMVVKETFFREDDKGNKIYFYADDVETESDDKGRVTSALSKDDGQPVTVGRVEKMSKSKNNGVDPQKIIDEYGADTARLFILFAAPPEKELEWNEGGVAGCFRYLRRVWSLVQNNSEAFSAETAGFSGKGADAPSKADKAFVRETHGYIKNATEAMEGSFSFNTVVADCMKLANALDPQKLDGVVFAWGVGVLLRLLSPMAPHICAELWAVVGEGTLEEAGWPAYDEAELVADEVEYPVQIKGKVRGRITLPAGLDAKGLEEAAMANDTVKELIGDKSVRKFIGVPGKIINIIC